jgi:ABC-type polysaccharide/polyol phosphate transport system ATPase subunit
MSGDIAIRVDGLSKKFTRKDGSDFWALKDISFEVKKGEMLGVIGANGSGKSTLLNILSAVIKPTEGKAQINGSYSSVLDIGSGFHPELSGRENIKMKAALLGFRNVSGEAAKEIIEFSGIEEFIDEPIKTYSNGMYIRLAFSIFKYLKQDILFVDEVLSAGDLEFQTKILRSRFFEDCSGIIVSHELLAIEKYCSRVLVLDKGEIVEISNTNEAMLNYQKKSVHEIETKLLNNGTAVVAKSVLDKVMVDSVSLFGEQNEEGHFLSKGELVFEMNLSNLLETSIEVGVVPHIKMLGHGLDLHSDSPYMQENAKVWTIGAKGTLNVRFSYPLHFFGKGIYSLGVNIISDDVLLERLTQMAYFEVDLEQWEKNQVWSDFPIVNRTRLNWDVTNSH